MGESGPEQLLADLADGRESAFAALYQLFGARLFRTANTLLNSSTDAEDAVQEVFVSLVRSRSRLREVENISAYLFASLRRAAARIGQRRVRDPRHSLDSIDAECRGRRGASSTAEQLQQRAVWLREAVNRLPPDQREVIALKVDGELTFAEIAATLGISANTAASRYRYALEKLRALTPQELIE